MEAFQIGPVEHILFPPIFVGDHAERQNAFVVRRSSKSAASIPLADKNRDKENICSDAPRKHQLRCGKEQCSRHGQRKRGIILEALVSLDKDTPLLKHLCSAAKEQCCSESVEQHCQRIPNSLHNVQPCCFAAASKAFPLHRCKCKFHVSGPVHNFF